MALIQKRCLPCVISPCLKELQYSDFRRSGRRTDEFLFGLLQRVELETKKDFIRVLGLERPDMKNI